MLEPVPQFTAPSYGDRTLNEVARCVNLYPQEDGNGGWELISTPGYSPFATGTAFGQGLYRSTTGKLFFVDQGTVYEVDYLGTKTSRGTIAETTNAVFMADNGTQLFIVSGYTTGVGYTLVMTAGSVTAVADGNLPRASCLTYQDGYFIVSKEGTGEFYLSALLDGTNWTPVKFATAESKGDKLVGLISNGTQLYLIGSQTMEVWYNTGNSSFPFERMNGAIYQIGCAQVQTIAQLNGDIFFFGVANNTTAPVWMISGTSPKRISNPKLEAIFKDFIPQSTYGFVYQLDGASFYEIVDTVNNRSFVYNIGNGTWFEKDSFFSPSYIAESIRYIAGAIDNTGAATGRPIGMGRGAFGGLYSMGGDASYNRENTSLIRRIRSFGPIESNTKKLFHYQIRIEADILYDSTFGAASVSLSLDWTDNNGYSYSTPITLTATTVSNTSLGQRVIWVANRLGSSPSRYYRITLTGPAAKIILKKCELDAKEGRF